VHRNAEGDCVDAGEVGVRIERGVALVHDDDGVRTAVPCGRQVALEAAWIEVVPKRRHEEDGVDVRRHDLRDRAPPGLLAREGGATREHRLDDRFPLACELSDRDPVSRRREGEPFELPGGETADSPVRGEELARAVVPRGDARGCETFQFVGPERIREERVPAEIFELQCDSFGLRNEKAPGWARTGSLGSRCAR
jgi:hypothetical protein